MQKLSVERYLEYLELIALVASNEQIKEPETQKLEGDFSLSYLKNKC